MPRPSFLLSRSEANRAVESRRRVTPPAVQLASFIGGSLRCVVPNHRQTNALVARCRCDAPRTGVRPAAMRARGVGSSCGFVTASVPGAVVCDSAVDVASLTVSDPEGPCRRRPRGRNCWHCAKARGPDRALPGHALFEARALACCADGFWSAQDGAERACVGQN